MSSIEQFGDSDVSDFMMMTDFRCRWQNHYVGDFFRYVGDFLNLLNRSPTSCIGHQHLKLVTNTFGLQHPSPTSMLPPNYYGRVKFYHIKCSRLFKIGPTRGQLLIVADFIIIAVLFITQSSAVFTKPTRKIGPIEVHLVKFHNQHLIISFSP